MVKHGRVVIRQGKNGAGLDYVSFHVDNAYRGVFYFQSGTPDKIINKFTTACAELIATQFPIDGTTDEWQYEIKHNGVTIHTSDGVSLYAPGESHGVFYFPWDTAQTIKKQFGLACADLIAAHLHA